MERVTKWLEELAKNFLLPERMVFKLDLVLNEALPNIICYAFQDQLPHDILVRFKNKDNYIVLEIIDDGTPFDPFAREAFQQPLSLDSAAIDGRGIHLINSFTDRQEYERINNCNIMRLSILQSPSASNQPSTTAL